MSASRSTCLLTLSVVAALLAPAAVRAEPTRIDFAGHVTSVNTTAYPGVALGAPVSGFVVYESVASGDLWLGTAPYGFSFDYAGTVVSRTLVFQGVANETCYGLAADCVRFGEAGHTLNFIDMSRSLLTNDTMPGADVLRSFPIIGLNENVGGSMNFYAEIDQVTITPVPEPGGWALMLAGLGAIGRAACRRRG